MRCPVCTNEIAEHSSESALRCYRRLLSPARDIERLAYADPGASLSWAAWRP